MVTADFDIPALFSRTLTDLGIAHEAVYLFGSRASGNAKKDSDYDFLVVLDGDFDRSARSRFFAKTTERIHQLAPGTSFDIQFRNRSDFHQFSGELNTLDHTVISEGIRL